MTTAIDTTDGEKWTAYRFTALNHNFVSKILIDGNVMESIVKLNLSNKQFIDMNIKAIVDMKKFYKNVDMKEFLELINRGASHAIVELDTINA